MSEEFKRKLRRQFCKNMLYMTNSAIKKQGITNHKDDYIKWLEGIIELKEKGVISK